MDVTRIVIIDVSASMDSPFITKRQPGVISRLSFEDHKFKAAKEYLRFAIQKMPSNSKLIIISFASSAEIVYHGVTNDKFGIEKAISRLKPDGSSTNLASAFQKVIDLLSVEGYAIKPLDVITDGLSNAGNPVAPARELQKRFGAYIHIYLIDPDPEGKKVSYEIVGNYGEGEVDPVISAKVLMDKGIKSAHSEDAFYNKLESLLSKHSRERKIFLQDALQKERPKFSIASPEIISPNFWSPVNIFIYLKDYKDLVLKEIQRLQNSMSVDYTQISSEFSKTIADGTAIRVMLSSELLQINPKKITIYWHEPYNRLSFRIIPINKDRKVYTAFLNVDISADDLPISSIRIPITVNSDITRIPVEPIMNEAQWYEDIFASYAREDLGIVKHLKKRYAALGLYMFIDLEDLRSGALWRPELFKRIDNSDLFQLFWSNYAQQSEYVTIEWEHALRAQEIKGGRFIRPVYWEDPIPDIPKKLEEFNFRRLIFRDNLSDACL